MHFVLRKQSTFCDQIKHILLNHLSNLEFEIHVLMKFIHFIIARFCQKADQFNFIKFLPLIKTPGPFCHSSAEPKSQIFGNFSLNRQRTKLKRLWRRHRVQVDILFHVIARRKCLLIGELVRGIKKCTYRFASLK